jgi:hypothetical protein
VPDDLGPNSGLLNLPDDRVPLEWGATVTYGWDFGNRAMPTAGPPGSPPAFVQIHGGLNVKTVTWATSFAGANPWIPDPFTVPANEVIVGALLCNPIPGALPDGTPVISIAGQYVYVLKVPIALGRDSIPLGKSPFIQGGTQTLNPADFLPNLIQAVQNPTGGPGGWQVGKLGY